MKATFWISTNERQYMYFHTNQCHLFKLKWPTNFNNNNLCQLFLILRTSCFPGLGIPSFAHRSFAHSLICSFRSNQMSDCERFAHIAQDKWATVSESLRSLRGNEQPWANRSGRSRQLSDCEQFAQVTHDKWANEQFAQQILAKKI